jgi:hypothetical protein
MDIDTIELYTTLGHNAFVVLLLIGKMTPGQVELFEKGTNKTFIIRTLLRQVGIKMSEQDIEKSLIILKQYYSKG